MERLQLLAFGDMGWGDELARGLAVTLALALATAPLALVLSFLLAWAKNSRRPALRVFANLYTTVFRSLPELLTLIIIYYQLQVLLNYLARVIWADANISLNAFASGVLALTLVFSALGSEVVRSAYQAVGKGQAEAARARPRAPACFLPGGASPDVAPLHSRLWQSLADPAQGYLAGFDHRGE